MIIKNLYKKFNELTVLNNFSCEIKENKITCFFGPSGCGKTTLINIISSLLKYDSGEIIPENPKISMVFQEERILPWLSVKKNLDIISNNSQYYLDAVGLSEYKDILSKNISGGMKRRLSIARALCADYEIIIMDEPFKGIDRNTKFEIIKFIKSEINKRTCIFITHDIEEASVLSDEIILLKGPPLKIEKIIELNIPFENKKERLIYINSFIK